MSVENQGAIGAGKTAGIIGHAKNRSTAVVASLQKAMSDIELDIDANDGIYPFNGGRLSQAELCRRARIKPTTLLGPSHKETTKTEVDDWLKEVQKRLLTGKKRIRRAITDRADAWKHELEAIALQFHLAELRMIDMRNENTDLKAENAALRKSILEKSVIPIKRGSKKSPDLPT